MQLHHVFAGQSPFRWTSPHSPERAALPEAPSIPGMTAPSRADAPGSGSSGLPAFDGVATRLRRRHRELLPDPRRGHPRPGRQAGTLDVHRLPGRPDQPVADRPRTGVDPGGEHAHAPGPDPQAPPRRSRPRRPTARPHPRLAPRRGRTPVGPQPGSMLGHLFESLVTLCLRVPAQAAAVGRRCSCRELAISKSA